MVLFNFSVVLFTFSLVLFSFVMVLFACSVVLFTVSGGPVYFSGVQELDDEDVQMNVMWMHTSCE